MANVIKKKPNPHDEEYQVFAHFVGTINKVQTLRGGDGDFRITIDIPGQNIEAIKELMQANSDYALCAFAVARKPKKE